MTANLQVEHSGPFVLAKGLEIPGLGRRRKIWAFLPDDYAQNPTRRYPVIYFQDGQNIFEPWKTPFGQSWEVHHTMRRLSMEGIAPAILIGIEHGGKRRVKEFQPLKRNGEFAPEGNAYADFLANKLKPFVDQKLRTLPDRAQHTLVGSSMGGLIALYAGMKHQDVFGQLGIFSPSLWAAPALFPLIRKVGRHYPMKIYLTAGKEEGAYTVRQTESMHKTLLSSGFPQNDLYLGIREKGKHEENFWRAEFETFYRWITEDY